MQDSPKRCDVDSIGSSYNNVLLLHQIVWKCDYFWLRNSSKSREARYGAPTPLLTIDRYSPSEHTNQSHFKLENLKINNIYVRLSDLV